MKPTENKIQGMKAQEAKDLAVKFLRELESKEKAPLSAGEAQLKELQYELQLKEAEAEDRRQRESHEQRIKELELQVEQEKTRQSEAASRAQAVRDEHAQLLEQVDAAKESLSVQLDRATREHNLRLERLEADYDSRSEELKLQLQDMQQRRDGLMDQINELSEIHQTAEDIGQLREMIESNLKTKQQELHQLEEQVADLEYQKTKKIKEIERQQELTIAELETEHKKNVLHLNRQSAEEILSRIGMIAVGKDEFAQLQKSLQTKEECGQRELTDIRATVREEVRREYNITTAEVIDVTELYYRNQSVHREADAMREQIDKLDVEIKRMREHIEREPQRIATAVEAAKSQVQNFIEQGPKR